MRIVVIGASGERGHRAAGRPGARGRRGRRGGAQTGRACRALRAGSLARDRHRHAGERGGPGRAAFRRRRRGAARLADPAQPRPGRPSSDQCGRHEAGVRRCGQGRCAAAGLRLVGRHVRACPWLRAGRRGWPATGIGSSSYSCDKATVEGSLTLFERAHPEIRVARLRPALIMHRTAASEVQRYFIGGVPGVLFELLRRRVLPLCPCRAGCGCRWCTPRTSRRRSSPPFARVPRCREPRRRPRAARGGTGRAGGQAHGPDARAGDPAAAPCRLACPPGPGVARLARHGHAGAGDEHRARPHGTGLDPHHGFLGRDQGDGRRPAEGAGNPSSPTLWPCAGGVARQGGSGNRARTRDLRGPPCAPRSSTAVSRSRRAVEHDLLADVVVAALRDKGATVTEIRLADLTPRRRRHHLGEGDEWLSVHEQLVGSEILIVASPTWSQAVLVGAARDRAHGRDALGADDEGRPVAANGSGVVVTGNEDGAHDVITRSAAHSATSATRCPASRSRTGTWAQFPAGLRGHRP